jgi:hypothetical protein
LLQCPREGSKKKSALKSPSAALKQKRVKILANRPKSYYTERDAVIPALLDVVTDETTVLPLRNHSSIILKVADLDFYSNYFDFL